MSLQGIKSNRFFLIFVVTAILIFIVVVALLAKPKQQKGAMQDAYRMQSAVSDSSGDRALSCNPPCKPGFKGRCHCPPKQ